jgi:hypothetical protein
MLFGRTELSCIVFFHSQSIAWNRPNFNLFVGLIYKGSSANLSYLIHQPTCRAMVIPVRAVASRPWRTLALEKPKSPQAAAALCWTAGLAYLAKSVMPIGQIITTSTAIPVSSWVARPRPRAVRMAEPRLSCVTTGSMSRQTFHNPSAPSLTLITILTSATPWFVRIQHIIRMSVSATLGRQHRLDLL